MNLQILMHNSLATRQPTVRFSPLAVKPTSTPVRQHSKRRGSARYHARVQKKWNKRFGFVKAPCIYDIAVPSMFGQMRMIVAHPSYEQQLSVMGIAT